MKIEDIGVKNRNQLLKTPIMITFSLIFKHIVLE